MPRTLVIIGSAILITGSMAVIAAQHVTPAARHQPLQMLHSLCTDPAAAGETAKAHVSEHFSKMLDLSSAQLADIERIATEACAVMRRTHESILRVLTPEQRAKIREHHGGDHDDVVAEFFKKLHGRD